MGIAHDVKEIPPQQRFAASDVQLELFRAEIALDIVEDLPVLFQRQLRHAVVFTAAAAAVKAALIAAERQLQE